MAGFSGSLGSLWVEIGARIDGLLKGMDAAKKSAGDVVKTFEKIATVGEAMSDVGKKLTLGLTAPMVAFAGYAIKASSDFDSAMLQVSARGDITGKDLDTLKGKAEALGAATKFSSKEAAEGMAELAGAGFKTQEIFDAMPGIMDLAAASTTSVGDAAGITKDTLGQFGLAAADTGKVVDIITAAGNASSGTITEMGYTLKYVGTVAKAAGLDLEQTAAAILVLDKAGIRGTQAGTSLRSMLVSLQAPTDKAREKMAELGIVTTDANNALLPLPEIITRMQEGFTKLAGPADKAAALSLIFGENALSAAQAIMSAGAPALELYETKMRDVGGETKRTADTMQSGMGGALEKMKGSLETASQKIGDLMAPAVKALAGVVEGAANSLAGFAGWFKELPVPVQAAAGGVALFTAALGPAAYFAGEFVSKGAAVATMLKQLYPELTLAQAAVTALTTAKTTLSNVISASLTPALITLGAAIIALELFKLAEELGNLGNEFGEFAANVTGNKNIIGDLADSFIEVFTGASVAEGEMISIGEQFDQCVSHASKAKDEVSFLGQGFDRLGKFVKAVDWTTFLNPIGGVITSVKILAGAIGELNESYRFMDKQVASTLDNLKQKNNEQMRSQIASAMQVVTSTKAHADLNEKLKAQAAAAQKAKDEIDKHTKSHKEGAATAVPFADKMWSLTQRFEMEQSAIKKSGEEAIKWLAAHKSIESQTPKLTEVTDELNTSIVLLIQNEKLVAPAFLDAGKQAEDAMSGLAKQTKELATARKEAGIADIDLMKKQADAAEQNYRRIADAAGSSSEDIQTALDAWQEKQGAVIFEEGGKLPDEYQKQLDVFANKTEVAGEKQKDLWSSMMKQVSTIISDAGKSIVDKLFNMGAYNAKLDEQAADLRDNLAEREQSYNDFAETTKTALAEAEATYQETLAKSAEDLKSNLAERQQDYEDFAKEVAGKFDTIRDSHAKEADKERDDVQDSLMDRTQDYEDYVGDINDKRSKIRSDSIKSETKERKALQDSLADKKLDYDRYVEDVAIKVQRIRDKNKGQYSEEEADLVKSLQRRTEDFNAFQQENLASQSGLAQKYAADQAAEEAELQKSLDRKTREFEEYKADVATKLSEITTKHQEAQAKEETDLQNSLDKKRAALDKYTQDAVAKAEEVNAKAAEKLESQKSTLESKLADQLAQWEKYKNDIGAKLDEIEEKHRTVLGNIGQVGIDVFKELGGAVARFVSEFLIGQLFKQLATLTDDIFPSLGKAMEKVFGKAADTAATVASDASEAGSAISGGAQQAGGAAQTAAGGAMQAGIMGLTNMVSGLVTAVTGVIGIFQEAHQETSLNAIEHNTRYSMMYLGERGDGGILGRLFDIADKTQWIPGLLDAINLKMDNWLQPLNTTLQLISGQIDTSNMKLGEISTSTMWGSKPEQEYSFKFDAMLAELRTIAAKNLSVTVNVTGTPGTATSNVKLAGLNAI